MNLVFLENCSYKKSVLLFLSTSDIQYYFLYESKQQVVLNAIRSLLSSFIASMAKILINFQ